MKVLVQGVRLRMGKGKNRGPCLGGTAVESLCGHAKSGYWEAL